jgi:hypothetical protein
MKNFKKNILVGKQRAAADQDREAIEQKGFNHTGIQEQDQETITQAFGHK